MGDEKAALALLVLDDWERSELLKPLADATTHVVDIYPTRHHPTLGRAWNSKRSYTTFFKGMFLDVPGMHISVKTKEHLYTKQRAMNLEWRITGTKQLPWPRIRLDNVVTRLSSMVIELIHVVMGSRKALSHSAQQLLRAETSDATNAAQSDGSNMVSVCQEILLKHPYTMTDQCATDLTSYVEGLHHIIAQRIMDSAHQRGGQTEFDNATAAMDAKVSEFKTSISQLQAVINHEMLLALGKLLPTAKNGGLVLPKLERAFSLFNAEERTKHRDLHIPFSA